MWERVAAATLADAVPAGSVAPRPDRRRRRSGPRASPTSGARQTREEESGLGGATFYDQVYDAERPELFFKATPSRVRGPGEPIRVRADSNWSVPEPELALVITAEARDRRRTRSATTCRSRDIEGENPLYLPQAKVYDGCCASGPCIVLVGRVPPPTS